MGRKVNPHPVAVRAPLLSELPAVRDLLAANGWSHRLGDAAWFEALVARSRCLVAVDGEAIVGFARAVTDGLSNGYLSMVVVAQANRRQGVGGRLVQELTGNAPGITWVLRAERPGAREFFEALGFSASGSAMERARQDPKAAPHQA